MEVPNLSEWRRSTTGDLTSTLDLSQPDMSAPTLPTASATDPVVVRECPPHEIVTPVPTYPVPATSSLPTQEPGTARRRPKAPADPSGRPAGVVEPTSPDERGHPWT